MDVLTPFSCGDKSRGSNLIRKNGPTLIQQIPCTWGEKKVLERPYASLEGRELKYFSSGPSVQESQLTSSYVLRHMLYQNQLKELSDFKMKAYKIHQLATPFNLSSWIALRCCYTCERKTACLLF